MSTPFEPKVKKVVTRPVLKFEKGKPVNVRILAAFYTGVAPPRRAGSTKEPVAPTLAEVVNLTDGTEATLPVHTSLKNTFNNSYPDQGYIGKCFSITAKSREPGRQFTPYHLVEIEDPIAAESGSQGEAPAATHSAIGGRRR